MAGKEPAGLGISGRVGELRVNRGVLNIGMAKPVFDKGKVGAGVEQVCGNRMLKAMELHLCRIFLEQGRWHSRRLASRLRDPVLLIFPLVYLVMFPR